MLPYSSYSDMVYCFFYVPEVLNVHVNENNKKNLLFSEGFFFQAVKNELLRKEM